MHDKQFNVGKNYRAETLPVSLSDQEELMESILAYKNDNVIFSFRKSFDIPVEDATEIFREMLRWLWLNHVLSVNYSAKEKIGIDDPIIVIDEMWHSFILHTLDYTLFCQKFFGRYMHHKPTTEDEIKRYKIELAEFDGSDRRSYVTTKKRTQYSAIYDLIGPENFKKWYIEFPQKYPRPSLNNLRR